MALERTATDLGVDLLQIGLERIDGKRWRAPGCRATSVEQAVLQCFEPDGWVGYWREGGLLLNLIKAMSFPTMLPRQKHTFIESIYAQNGTPENRFEKGWLLHNVRNATRDQISRNAHLMLTGHRGDSAITEYFPGLEHWMFLGLFDALGRDAIYAIASRFAEDPYEYAKGWPDVTMWKQDAVRFLEVKAPGDSLQKSQWIIARQFIGPFSLQFELVAVQSVRPELSHATKTQVEIRHVKTVKNIPPGDSQRHDGNKPTSWTIGKTSYWNTAKDSKSPANVTWTEVENAIRNRPEEGLTMALAWQPRAAWHAAMKAIRTLIRDKRKSNEDDSAELFLLYASAAIDSLTPHFSKKCQRQGAEIADAIPRSVFEGLQITYDKLGYEKLRLLSLTDIQWIVEAWGEPSTHSTLYEMEKRIWEKWENKYWILENTYVDCPQCGFPIQKSLERFGDLSKWCITCSVSAPDKSSIESNLCDSDHRPQRDSDARSGCSIVMIVAWFLLGSLFRSLN